MRPYRFLTTWLLDAPRERMWDGLYDARSGIWRLYESELGTASTWEWTVATTAPWMNAFGPLARPPSESACAFREMTLRPLSCAWNHHRIMRRGADGLARELGCALVAAS